MEGVPRARQKFAAEPLCYVLDLAATRLRPGGRLHVATDWPSYAAQVLEVVAASRDLQLRSTDRGGRPSTRFERRGVAAGRPITDVVALRR